MDEDCNNFHSQSHLSRARARLQGFNAQNKEKKIRNYKFQSNVVLRKLLAVCAVARDVVPRPSQTPTVLNEAMFLRCCWFTMASP